MKLIDRDETRMGLDKILKNFGFWSNSSIYLSVMWFIEEQSIKKDARTYKKELEAKIHELKNIDRSKNFTKEEMILIDKVYNSVLQVMELEIDYQ